MIPPGSTIGILGGGQLGKMLAQAAATLGYQTIVWCDREDSPAFGVATTYYLAPYDDSTTLEKFATACDVVTVEFENIPADTGKYLEQRTLFRPNVNSLYISQNRIREKTFLQSLGIATAPFQPVEDLLVAAEAMGYPSVFKTAEFGYDGKGQWVLNDPSDLQKVTHTSGILEKWIPFEMEISVVAARSASGEFASFPPVQNIHKNGILDQTIAPANLPDALKEQAIQITKTLMEGLEYVGTLAVEFFVEKEETLLVNEFAPRPHNSGHWTLDACLSDQFEQHIRAICDLPLGDCQPLHSAVMTNLIGDAIHQWSKLAADPRAKIHLYGKKECRPGRKMGHVTTLHESSKDDYTSSSSI